MKWIRCRSQQLWWHFSELLDPAQKFFERLLTTPNHAPDEILALSNEISDINILLSDIEATARFIDQAGEPKEQSTLSAPL